MVRGGNGNRRLNPLRLARSPAVAHDSLGRAEKKARRERRTLVCVDADFYLLPPVVRTSAPCGETPGLRPFLTRDPLSVRGAITPADQLYTLVRKMALTDQESRKFLRHLPRHVADKLLVIWDGASIP
jgi:hypothetical protein